MPKPTTIKEETAAGESARPEPVPANFSFFAAAMSRAQAKMTAAEKDRENPHFKSDYATLNSIREAGRMALANEGIAVLQIPDIEEGMIILRTTLLHTSGESATSNYPVCAINTRPQDIGSALTYARKNALGAMSGVAPKDNPDDDDGNKANASYVPPPQKAARTPNPPAAAQVQGRPTLKDQASGYIAKIEAASTWEAFMAVIAEAGDLVERIRLADKTGAWTARINEIVDAKRTALEPENDTQQEAEEETQVVAADEKTAGT